VSFTCTGFRFAGVASGIKAKKALDLGLLVSDLPAHGAAVFTRNRVVAAPVTVSRKRLAKTGGLVRGIVVNSGNANACTGANGAIDAKAMADRAAEAVDIRPQEMLVASTGVIGVPLPMDHVNSGIEAAAPLLRAGHFDQFARAILTTDRSAKIARRQRELGGSKITLLGCTKGAGMIAPNMATTLSFVVTDAKVNADDLHGALAAASDATYNAMTVDGDTSTNDMILLIANGAAKNRPMGKKTLEQFRETLTELLSELAVALMREAEGVHHVVSVNVVGAKTKASANTIAHCIANSPLVKTAIAGCDPNWGRVLAAAGRAGVPLTAEKLSLRIGDVLVAANGAAVDAAEWESTAQAVMQAAEYAITLDLGLGSERACVLACDLSHEYVSINADYRS